MDFLWKIMTHEKSWIFHEKSWLMKSHGFFKKNHDSWKLMNFLLTIMTHENSWFFYEQPWLMKNHGSFMNNHDSWKIMNFYEQSWLMKIHEFLWTTMTDFFGRLFWPKTWLFMTFWWHSGIILGPSRDHSKVILSSFRWLFGDFSGEAFSGTKIDLGWSGHLVEVVSCRSRLLKNNFQKYFWWNTGRKSDISGVSPPLSYPR